MTKALTKKICIVVSSLGGGGAERSSALLSQLLFDLGYEVHIISVLNNIDFPYKGTLLNLGKLKEKDDSSLGRLKRLRVLKKYLKRQQFDYIIDNRTRIGLVKEFIISKWLYNSNRTIYCVRSYNTHNYISANVVFGRLLYASAFKIICVSKAIRDRLSDRYRFKNLGTIHNPIPLNINSFEMNVSKNESFILFYGRLDDDVKNISLLLEAYGKSRLPSKGYKLKIVGDGKDKNDLKKITQDLRLETSVEFLGFQSDPHDIVQAAYFTVLTSKYEGFPRVLLESLALGTPVVSVDCNSGPSEIIEHEKNGLLVENYNADALINAMNRMIEDEDLYVHCKSNASKSVEKFSMSQIGQEWKRLLK